MSRSVMLVGGGTGGHITPLLAVARELKDLNPDIRLIYVGEQNGKFAHLLEGHSQLIDESHSIKAGKLRRYYGEAWLKRLFDVRTNWLNLRDMLRTFVGFWQSLRLLRMLNPEVIFIKGGFVGVPVGLAAAWLKIPYVTHDSDTLPGIANRLIARWAYAHAVGMPKEFYAYPPDKTYFVGIPLGADYQPVTPSLKAQYRRELGLHQDGKVILVTGGSQGAQRLNAAFLGIASDLLSTYPDLTIIHQAGKGNQALYHSLPETLQARVVCHEFIADLFRNSGAADVVLTRAGATTLAELAVQGKACIVVPNPQLTGGHQTKNAHMLEDAGAAIVIDEEQLKTDSAPLVETLQNLLDSSDARHKLEVSLAKMGQLRAAQTIAELLLKVHH